MENLTMFLRLGPMWDLLCGVLAMFRTHFSSLSHSPFPLSFPLSFSFSPLLILPWSGVFCFIYWGLCLKNCVWSPNNEPLCRCRLMLDPSLPRQFPGCLQILIACDRFHMFLMSPGLVFVRCLSREVDSRYVQYRSALSAERERLWSTDVPCGSFLFSWLILWDNLSILINIMIWSEFMTKLRLSRQECRSFQWSLIFSSFRNCSKFLFALKYR